ncbi:MAG TPA: hypothetical protein VF820_06060, partial [Patescibacteria group bacterium]
MKIKQLFLCLYVFSLIIFLAHFFIVGKAVYGDGRYYYSYLPSLLIEHTLNLTTAFKNIGINSFTTPIGLPANIYPVGPAIVWTIPYLTSFLLFNHSAYGLLHQVFVGIWNVSLVVLGLYFLYLSLCKFFDKATSFLAILTTFFTTNLFFYGTIDVINSHSSSFFFASLFLFLWFKKQTFVTSLFQGLSLGMLTLIRPQDGIFILLPIFSFLFFRKLQLKNLITIIISSAITFSLQMIYWHFAWGSWFHNPYLTVAHFNFFTPQILGVLFNKTSGLLLWTPLFAIGIGGTIALLKKYIFAIPFLLIFLIELYLISAWSIWWQGASYSGRMFISTLPLLSFGTAYLYEKK